MNPQYNQSASSGLFQMFDSKLAKTRTKSNDPFSSTMCAYYNLMDNNNTDYDKLRDELIKAKSEYNKKNQDYHTLRVTIKKLEVENQESAHFIEELLNEANKKLLSSAEEMITYNDDDFIERLGGNMSKESTAKLFSRYYVLKMKHEIIALREEIKKKNNEINDLKSSAKVVKYQDLDGKYAQTSLELAELTDKYIKASQIQNEMKNNNDALIYQLNEFQRENRRQKLQLNKTQKQMSIPGIHLKEKENDKEKEKEPKTPELSTKEHKMNNHIKALSKQLKDKEKDLACLRERYNEIEKILFDMKEKENKNKDKVNKEAQLKEDIKKRNNKIQDLEKKNLDLFSELEKVRNYAKKQPMKNLTKIEKDNNELKEANEVLKKEVNRLTKELKKYINDSPVVEKEEIQVTEPEQKEESKEHEDDQDNDNNYESNQGDSDDNLFITGKAKKKKIIIVKDNNNNEDSKLEDHKNDNVDMINNKLENKEENNTKYIHIEDKESLVNYEENNQIEDQGKKQLNDKKKDKNKMTPIKKKDISIDDKKSQDKSIPQINVKENASINSQPVVQKTNQTQQQTKAIPPIQNDKTKGKKGKSKQNPLDKKQIPETKNQVPTDENYHFSSQDKQSITSKEHSEYINDEINKQDNASERKPIDDDKQAEDYAGEFENVDFEDY